MKELLDKMMGLPGTVKAGLAAGAIALAFTVGLVGRSGLWIVLTILVLAALLLGGYLLWQAWKRHRESSRFATEMRQQSAATPRGISDPGKRAKLDDLHRRFEDGLTEYKARGKDLYTLPWFLIVGESGSGKTEAIRHCNVGFPPGMQDEMQGAGGTVNMNWWFTNHGVFLDTAGRLMFEEVKPGETSEWQEFLTLLRKARPTCPVNGLLLVIPADSLLKDSPEQIKARAGRIAQQLDVIQRALDIRFPVFLVITKCDLLIGFREFSDVITEPVLQQQIMGWSNPDPLDAPFRPDQVDQHLVIVAERLRRRALGLLRDPVAVNPPNRRLSEVDALYALPATVGTAIGPSLRRYLETIFVAGEWSAKPLFLRGLYFTSSLREGTALDQEVAQALGMAVTELPQGRVWERERSFFLRDLFMEKVFRERGLVTRATNTRKAQRRRQIILLTCGSAALAGFLALGWFGRQAFQKSVGAQSIYWKTAAQGLEDHKSWPPLVSADSADPALWRYHGDDPVALAGLGRKQTLIRFHAALRELAAQPLRISWIFRPIAHGSRNFDIKRAQRIVFEDGVLEPLVAAARKKITRLAPDTATPPASTAAALERQSTQAAALVALIQIEADLLNRQEGRKRGVIETADTAQKFLAPLLRYVAAKDTDRSLADTMAWTYSAEGGGRGTWPPAWLSAGNNLGENEPIRSGLDQFLQNASQTSQGLDLLKGLRDALREYQAKEEEFNQLPTGATDDALKLLAALQVRKERLDQQLAAATKAGLLTAASSSVVEGYNHYVNDTRANLQQVFASIEAELEKVGLTATLPGEKPANDATLFREIREKLATGRARIEDRLRRSFSADELQELRALDEPLLTNNGDGRHLYEVRFDLYQRVDNLLRHGLGFPLLAVTGGPTLDLEHLKQTRLGLLGLERDLAPTNSAALPAAHRQDLKRLQTAIAPLTAVARVLLDDNNVAGAFTINLDASQDRPTAFKYRGVEVVCPKSEGSKDPSREREQKLAEGSIDQGLTIRLYLYPPPEPPVNTREFPQWGAIALLLRYKDRVTRSEDGKTWALKYPVDERDGAPTIGVKCLFERPLPDFAHWPVR